jgi:hypothetical protein
MTADEARRMAEVAREHPDQISWIDHELRHANFHSVMNLLRGCFFQRRELIRACFWNCSVRHGKRYKVQPLDECFTQI